MVKCYGWQLLKSIQRGMNYNAKHALYNRHKLFGHGVNRATKKYVVNTDTAHFVRQMFDEYAAGRSMHAIADELNAEGLRTTRGVKTLNKMLDENHAYIGEHHYGSIMVEYGMPAPVNETTFDKMQGCFAASKRLGRYARSENTAEASRYRLVGKRYCGECVHTLQGVSRTSTTRQK